MKFIYNYLIVLSLAALATACNPGRVTISATVDNDMDFNGKWAYFAIIYGLQYDILDSCLIQDNEFQLTASIPHKEDLVEVFIPNGQSLWLLAAKGEKIELHIDSLTRSFFPASEGSFATTRMADISERYRTTGYNHLDSLKYLLETLPAEDPERGRVADSIRIRRQELNESTRDAIDNGQSALLAIVAKMWYLDENPDVPDDSLKVVAKSIAARFPKSAHLSMLDPGIKPERPTPRSIWAYNRKAQLLGRPLPYPNGKDEYEEPEKNQREYPAYKIGDVLKSFFLPDVGGKEIALSGILTDYILIDLWASWCAPCRKETPYLKEAAAKYAGTLTIYAVSLDEDRSAWTKAVSADGTQQFTHVILLPGNPRFDELVQCFALSAIPANFLLDKDRRIVAMNLRGEALDKKLTELTGR